MTGGERQIVLRDQRKHFEHFRQQLATPRDADERPLFLVVSDFVLRIVRRHPHDPAVVSGHVGHVADRLRIDPTDRRIEGETAKHFNPLRSVLPHEKCESRGFRVMVLENDAAQTAILVETSDLEPVPLARVAVGIAMRVQIDRANERRIRQMLVD